jgi:hypothetical protein
VHHERWNGDPWQQLGDVDVAKDVEQPYRRVGRCGEPLQFVELPHLLLRRVILVGHSSSGVVITGVADRAPERIAPVVYLDALCPTTVKPCSTWSRPTGARRLRGW